MSKSFQRTIEDFQCLHCGAKVAGDGYTNHCPHCLWSRHVDQHPGDRASDCLGLMPPMEVQRRGDSFRILHRCEQCGHEKWNRSAKKDDFEKLLQLARKSIYR